MGNDAKRKWYAKKDVYGTTVYNPDTKQSEPGRGSVIENPASGLRVAYVYWPNAEEHADFIVRACNAHDSLVEVLRMVEWSGVNSNGLPRCPICYGRKSENWHYEDCKLAAAIALATEAADD